MAIEGIGKAPGKGGGRNAKLRAPTVYKTEVFERIDRLSRDPEQTRRAIESLRSGSGLLDVASEAGAIGGGDGRREHLERHWLGSETDREVLRRALVRAGELVLEHRVPADVYWVFAGDRREVGVSYSGQQVTVIVVTPFPDVETEGAAPDHPAIEIFR